MEISYILDVALGCRPMSDCLHAWVCGENTFKIWGILYITMVYQSINQYIGKEDCQSGIKV